tara:strand:+ start:214 stop:672 length:459 start_codon:yes stop_codon:yes gene_type:complete
MVRHKCHIYQSHKPHEAFIGIGDKPTLEPLKGVRHTNPIKRALYYQSLLDEGKVDSKAELAKHLGVVRSRISTVLNLLNLDEEIQDFLLGLDDGDERLRFFNERRLRPIALIKGKGIQKEQFWKIIEANDWEVSLCRHPASKFHNGIVSVST